MKINLLIFTLLILSVDVFAAEGPSCPGPTANASSWRSYREQYARRVHSYTYFRAKRVALNREHKACLKRVKDSSSLGNLDKASIVSCMSNLTRMLDAVQRPYNLDTEAQRNMASVPDFLLPEQNNSSTTTDAERLARTFIDKVRRKSTAKDAIGVIEQMNRLQGRTGSNRIEAVEYRSGHIGAHGNRNALNRILVKVPGNPQKWLQYCYDDSNSYTSETTINVIGVYTDPTTGRRTTYFDDWQRVASNTTRVTPDTGYGVRSRGGGHDVRRTSYDASHKHDLLCVRCHKGGPNPIIPTPPGQNRNGHISGVQTLPNLTLTLSGSPGDGETITVNQEAVLNRINPSRLNGAAYVGGSGNYNMEDWGPQMGDTNESPNLSDPAFYQQCMSGVSGIPAPNPTWDPNGSLSKTTWFNNNPVYKQVKEAMDCASCHKHNTNLGPLNYPYGLTAQGGWMISRNVMSGHMPNDVDPALTVAQRQALFNCLKRDYYGIDASNNRINPFDSAMKRWMEHQNQNSTHPSRTCATLPGDVNDIVQQASYQGTPPDDRVLDQLPSTLRSYCAEFYLDPKCAVPGFNHPVSNGTNQ